MSMPTRLFDPDSALDRLLAGHRPTPELAPGARPRLSAAETAFLDTLRAWCADDALAAHVEASAQLPDRLLVELDELGAFRITIPRQYGGLGFSDACLLGALGVLSAAHSTLCEVVAAHQVVGAVRPLVMFGTEEQRSRYLPQLLHSASAFALNEAGLGYGIGPLSTTAWFDADNDCYRVSGTKTWITNATIASHAVVLVDLAHTPTSAGGITALLISSDDAGVVRGPHSSFAGLRGLPNGQLHFDDARIPADRAIGSTGEGIDVVLACLAACRAALPVACLATVTTCLENASAWAREERQTTRNLSTNPQIQAHLADLTTTALIANAVTWFALEPSCSTLDAEAAKVIVSELAAHAIDVVLQVVGGRGYETAASALLRSEPPSHIERIWRDTRITRIFDSSTEMLKDLIAQPVADAPKLQHLAPSAVSADATPPTPAVSEPWIAELSASLHESLASGPEDLQRRAVAVDCALALYAAHCLDHYRSHLGEDVAPTTAAWNVALDELCTQAEVHLRRLDDAPSRVARADLAAELTSGAINRTVAFTLPLAEIGATK